jgi:soluble lytic murein transglycosylase
MKWTRLILIPLFVAGCGGADAPTPTPTATLIAQAAQAAPAAPTVTPTVTLTVAAGEAAAPAPTEAAVVGAPVAALVLPTLTPTPSSPADAPDSAALAQVAAAVDAPAPSNPLDVGRRLQRYGDYAAARTALNQVVTDAAAAPARQAEALYDLGRAYLGEGLYSEALATFDRLDVLLASAGGDPGQFGQKEHFLRGEALLGMGRYAEAVNDYRQFLEAYPWMSESVQPRIARAYLASNDVDSASMALRRAVEDTEDRVARVGKLEDLAQIYLDGGRFADAAAVYDEILAVAENAGYRTQILYKAGQALAAGGDAPGAIERWRAATAESPKNYNAYLSLVELVNRDVEFDLYQRGYIDLVAEAHQPAINAYQAYLDSVAPTDARAGNALHGLGQAYLGVGSYAEALTVFDRVIAEYPSCDCFGQAWLDKGTAQASLGDSAGARRTYRTFARDFAADALAPEALWQSGRRALAEGNQVEAAVDFLTLADSFPASERAPQALYTLGVGAFDVKLYDQAADALARLQTGYPDYRWDAVGYWLGRSQAAAGQGEAARATWQALVNQAPDIYYGILASYALADIAMTDAAMLARIDAVAGPVSRLDGDDGSQAFAEQWLAGWLELPVDQVALLPPAIAEDPNLAKGRLLLELDQRGDALAALERVYQTNQDTVAALYPLSLEFARLGAYRLSILSAARLMQFSPAGLVESAPAFIQRLSFPQPFADLIEREATANGFDPLIYFSLIRQESLFEEGARSTAAAQGLAQIIPDTGQWVAQQLGHPEYTNDIIYRPVINLRFGAYYLDWVRDYLDGNLLSALVGYNAGPGNSENWREQAGADDALFVEKLTFSEPRAYVYYILSNLYHYTRLYAS